MYWICLVLFQPSFFSVLFAIFPLSLFHFFFHPCDYFYCDILRSIHLLLIHPTRDTTRLVLSPIFSPFCRWSCCIPVALPTHDVDMFFREVGRVVQVSVVAHSSPSGSSTTLPGIDSPAQLLQHHPLILFDSRELLSLISPFPLAAPPWPRYLHHNHRYH